MREKIKLAVAACLLFAIFFSSIYCSFVLNTDFGKVTSVIVEINFDQGKLSGLLFEPKEVDNQSTCAFPAIVVVHGISESAQILSSFGLELSRNGFVVLCLDLPGHGGSDGSINQAQNGSSLGVEAAAAYLANLPYVNRTQIGLIGHSLGAGAIRAANTELNNVIASILIGGGVGNSVNESEYGYFNASYPKNVLIVIGEYDTLFDVNSLEKKDLLTLFNTTEPIQRGALYGEFQSQTARKLIAPKTTHLFESIDSTVISQSITWMQQSMNYNQKSQLNLIYPYAEIFQTTALLSLIGLVLLEYYPVAAFLKNIPTNQPLNKSNRQNKKAYLVWFILNISLFLPFIFVGLLIRFPPLAFGSSIAWWLLATAVIGYYILCKTSLVPDFNKKSLIQKNKESFLIKNIVIGAILFLIALTVTTGLQTFGINLKLVAPIFQQFVSMRRILVFFTFLPFFLPYFFILHHYLINGISKAKEEYFKLIFVNISPFLLLLWINFLPKILFDSWLIPSFVGFVIEFLWLLTPIFLITTFCALYFYRRTGNLVTGTMFNTLIFAWIAATVFPF